MQLSIVHILQSPYSKGYNHSEHYNKAIKTSYSTYRQYTLIHNEINKPDNLRTSSHACLPHKTTAAYETQINQADTHRNGVNTKQRPKRDWPPFQPRTYKHTNKQTSATPAPAAGGRTDVRAAWGRLPFGRIPRNSEWAGG